MKTYWLVAVLYLQVVLPFYRVQGAGKDEEENEDPAAMLTDLVKVAVDELRNNPDLAEKLKDIVTDLSEVFSGKEYQGTFLPPVVKMIDTFLNNGYFLSPETLLKLTKSILNQATREPDKLSNNLRRVGHRGIKLVGDTIRNVGSLSSSVVRVVEDLHNKQSNFVDKYYGDIPYFGTILQKINRAIAKVIGTFHMVVKLGVKGVGTIISDYAERKRLMLKRKTEEERRAAKEAQEIDDEEAEGNDSDEEPENDGSQPKKGEKKKDNKTDPEKKKDDPKKTPEKKKDDPKKDS